MMRCSSIVASPLAFFGLAGGNGPAAWSLERSLGSIWWSAAAKRRQILPQVLRVRDGKKGRFSCDAAQNWWSETYLDQGKKKAKLTGTPDVVRFKGTREFCLLQARLKCDETSWHENERLGLKSRCQAALRQECKEIQESLPFVHEDPLDDFAYKKVG